MDDRRCAYCGAPTLRPEREHVVPRCLYPKSRASLYQRITVPACGNCNRGYADDEPHFRDVLVAAGEPNAAVREVWNTKTVRSFDQPDGHRRVRDLAAGLVPVTLNGAERYRIYPDRDPRVVRVLRKIVRGLCHFHGVETAVADERISVEVHKYRLPPQLAAQPLHHFDPKVFQYWWEVYDEPELASIWFLRFFERREFVAAVVPSTEVGLARAR